MRKALVFAAFILVVSCGGRRLVLSTPQNQAGTRSGVLPGYTQAAAAPPETVVPAEAAVTAAEPPAGTIARVEPADPPAGTAAAAEAARAEPAKKRADPGTIDVEIREKMFIAQTNDVYLNPEDYLGKSIKLEGLLKIDQYAGEDTEYCFVLRSGPGCCGNDGSAGFEVAWNRPEPGAGPASIKALPSGPVYPAVDAWVEAVGILDTYEEDGYPYIYLDLLSLSEKEERGAEFVTQ
jgi:hypothetical protein